jgi:hypothetical protein
VQWGSRLERPELRLLSSALRPWREVRERHVRRLGDADRFVQLMVIEAN